MIRNLWLYRKLSSIHTSLFFLAFLTFFCTIGTIFPQQTNIEDYRRAGGKMVWLIERLQLLELFTSPWFLAVSSLFFLNLLICSLERFRSYIKAGGGGNEEASHSLNALKSISLEEKQMDALLLLERVFRELGFRIERMEKKGEFYRGIATKGLPAHWLSLGYHLTLSVCLLGFFMTYLFAAEGYVTLYPGDKVALSTLKAESRWDYFLKRWGIERTESFGRSLRGISLTLEKFSTEYYQLPSFDYPKSTLSRLAHILRWSQDILRYDLTKKSLHPKDWKSNLAIVKDGNVIRKKTIEVNDPLRYGDLTFYQIGYEQSLDLEIDGKVLSLKTMEPFEIPGMDGKFRLGPLRVGMGYNRDGSAEEIIPHVELIKLSTAGTNRSEKILGSIQQGKVFTFSGHKFSIKNIKEATVLSYRYDPGASLLWFSSICLMILMALRLWGYSYRIRYFLDENRHAFFHFKIKGIWADEEKLLQRIIWKIENFGGS